MGPTKIRVAGIRRIFLTAVIFAQSLLFGHVSAQLAGSPLWQSELYTDHGLVGRIWDSRRGQFVTSAELWDKILGSTYLLLGEKHDNPDHHELQLGIIQALIGAEKLEKVTFEMLDSTSSENLRVFLETRFESEEELKSFLNWDEQGWNWGYYGALIEAAYDASIPVTAGNLDAETVMKVYSTPASEEIEAVLDEDAMSRLLADIDESHCGLLPESQFPPMVRVQQTRDYRMARSLLLSDKLDNGLALLITGNYHARKDLGVPNYLMAQHPGLGWSDILSLAFVEVVPGETDPGFYLDRFTDRSAYDFIWFTPAVSNADYCDSLR